jgi:hypothetical protein
VERKEERPAMSPEEKKAAIPKPRPIRAPKQFTRKQIQACKPDVRALLRFGTELQLMQYLRGLGIFDEDPRFANAVQAYRLLKKAKL